jgi:hypothetical protein
MPVQTLLRFLVFLSLSRRFPSLSQFRYRPRYQFISCSIECQKASNIVLRTVSYDSTVLVLVTLLRNREGSNEETRRK